MSEGKSASPLATGLAVLSFFISCASLYLANEANKLSVAEGLSVKVVPQTETLPVVIASHQHGNLDSVFLSPFQITLSNTGNRKLSVVSYDVFEISKHGGKSWYNNLDGGLVDSKGQPAELPIVLDAGQSTNVFARIGLMVSGAAVRELQRKFPDGVSLKPSELFRILADSGIDVYGNTVKKESVAPGGYAYDQPFTNLREQRFSLGFQTGKGTVVSSTLSWLRKPD